MGESSGLVGGGAWIVCVPELKVGIGAFGVDCFCDFGPAGFLLFDEEAGDAGHAIALEEEVSYRCSVFLLYQPVRLSLAMFLW
jgi:hypothetical protein